MTFSRNSAMAAVRKSTATGASAIADSTNVTTIIALFDKFLAEFRKRKLGRARAMRMCLSLIARKMEPDLLDLVEALPVAWADHAIASIYAMKMSRERRKNLGAYFTPPHLVDHLVSRLTACGANLVEHKLRDPAAGGAAFLVPLARIKVAEWRKQGLHDVEIVRRLRAHLVGREIEADLAKIANALLRRMLVREYKMTTQLASKVALVKIGDSLSAKRKEMIDHEVGNPPFLRLGAKDKRLSKRIFSEVVSGRSNLYALFVRRALDEVPAGGLVGYVIPASFLGGPEFTSFRRRVVELAEVLVVDLIEKRSDVFQGAVQDACFVVLKRRAGAEARACVSHAKSGIFRRDGKFLEKGTARIDPDGAPWWLPGIDLIHRAKLKDWGYRATVGYLVANRQSERLHKRVAKGRYPLIWAKAITSKGRFDFNRGAAFKGFGWVDAPKEAAYVVRTPCVAIQRTSSRGQKRRLNAAPVSKNFITEHGGVVAENHVILLVPISPNVGSPKLLAKALNSAAVSAELDRVCGTASISVRLLEKIELDAPPRPSTSISNPRYAGKIHKRNGVSYLTR